jgi:DnaK suppressor protein
LGGIKRRFPALDVSDSVAPHERRRLNEMNLWHSVRTCPFCRGRGVRRAASTIEAKDQNTVMNRAKFNQYRLILQGLRERVGGEVNHVVESIHEDVTVNTNVSSAPVHLADVAGAAVDADVEVLHTERSILDEINAALERIADGTFGRCTHCGSPISEERLKALPYAPTCVRCARNGADHAA